MWRGRTRQDPGRRRRTRWQAAQGCGPSGRGPWGETGREGARRWGRGGEGAGSAGGRAHRARRDRWFVRRVLSTLGVELARRGWTGGCRSSWRAQSGREEPCAAGGRAGRRRLLGGRRLGGGAARRLWVGGKREKLALVPSWNGNPNPNRGWAIY
jgi:hypothetical protein